MDELERRILAGDLRALAKAATLIESQVPVGRDLIAALFPRTGQAMIVGITGPAGVGKSTLTDRLASALRRAGRTVAIIAVDPSSPFSRGAILGDRIRMQEQHADAGVFIRSVAARGRLGGLARSTLEMALLFDAAGRDAVLIETVGVGQDEVEIGHQADVTVLVLAPGFGDDVQTMKAGIMEIADLFAINKADQPGAERLEQEIQAMQSVSAAAGGVDRAPVRRVIATENAGIIELLSDIEGIFERNGRRGLRAEAWTARLREMIRDDLMSSIPESELAEHAARVASKTEDPYAAVAALRLRMVAGTA